MTYRFKKLAYQISSYLILGIIISFSYSCSKTEKKIPIISTKVSNSLELLDTMEIRNHLNQPFQFSSLSNQIYTVNFFFTSCKTICPLMEKPLNGLAKSYKDIEFVSFTIDPDNDSVKVLKDYHKRHKRSNQTLLNTSKENLKSIAKLYLNAVDTDNVEDLYHTSNLVLLDRKMNIRGIYNLLDKDDIQFLEEGLGQLSHENSIDRSNSSSSNSNSLK